jgi:glycosyltransferase involved in cell wall biosynthesis
VQAQEDWQKISKNKDIILSIIVPVYNTEKYIIRCIESLIQQSLENIRIFLIDDGSSDNSSGICDQYARDDKRIHVVHTENCGVSSARNTGIRLAQTPFIMFVDSDDYVSPNLCHELVKAITVNQSDMALCGFRIIYNNLFRDISPDLPELMYDPFNCYLAKMHKFGISFYPFARVYRTEILKKNGLYFDPTLRTGEDRIFNMSYFRHINTISFSKKILYYYVQREGSATFSRPDVKMVEVFKKIYGALKELANTSEDETIANCLADQFLCEIMDCFGGKFSSNSRNLIRPYFKLVVNYPETKYACHFRSNNPKYHLLALAISLTSLRVLRICDLCTKWVKSIRVFLSYLKSTKR